MAEAVEFPLPRSGITLRGLRTGGEGPPTLCLHGWLDNCASFGPLLNRLGEHNLIAVDLPSHGHSDPLPSLTSQYLDHITAILELAHTQSWGQFQLIGHSLGGALSSLIAGLRPDAVTRLVLIDAIGPLSAEPEHSRDTVARYLAAFLAAQPAPVYRSRTQAVLARVQLADLLVDTAEALVERDLREIPGGFTWRSHDRLRYPCGITFTEPQVLTYLRHITAPTLLVTAERTALTEPFYPQRIASVADLRQVTLTGGHHLHMENPDPVAKTIADFLTSAQ